MTKVITAEFASQKKKVTLYFEDMIIDKIIAPEIDTDNPKAKVVLKQKAIRIVETTIHKPLDKDIVKVSPDYDDIRTKTQKISIQFLEDRKLEVGSKIKGEFIKRICSKEPFWPEQKASSSGYYITTELVSKDDIIKGDELRVDNKIVNVLATERDIYRQENGKIINIRINKNVTKKNLIVK